MRTNPTSEAVQASACEALCHMWFSETAVKAVVEAMRAHPGSVAVLSFACEALARMACADGFGISSGTDRSTWQSETRQTDVQKEKIILAGGARAVLAAMRACVSAEAVQRSGSAALSNLVGEFKFGKCEGTPVLADMATVLAAAMTAHPSSVIIQTNVFELIRYWLEDEHNAISDGTWTAFAEAGTVAAVVAAMRAHPDEAWLQESACDVLKRLVYCEKGYREEEPTYSIEERWLPTRCILNAGALPVLERCWNDDPYPAMFDLLTILPLPMPGDNSQFHLNFASIDTFF